MNCWADNPLEHKCSSSLEYDYFLGLTIVMTLQTQTLKLRPINCYVYFYPIICRVSHRVRHLRGRCGTLLNSEGFSGVHLHKHIFRFRVMMVCDESHFDLWNIWHTVFAEIRSQATWTICSFYCIISNNVILTCNYCANNLKLNYMCHVGSPTGLIKLNVLQNNQVVFFLGSREMCLFCLKSFLIVTVVEFC